MLTLLLLSTGALAAPLGVDADQIPPRPESRNPAESSRDIRARVLAGDAPDVLIPWRWTETGQIDAHRYYDGEGRVYRYQDALFALRQSPTVRADMQAHDRHTVEAMAWYVAGLTLGAMPMPLAPVGLVVALPAMTNAARVRSHRESALYHYNAEQ